MATMRKAGLRPLTIAERRELTMIAKAGSERTDRVGRLRERPDGRPARG